MSEQETRPLVGFIGLGVMGAPMARNLLRVGHPVVAFNRSRGPLRELGSLGASTASSPAEVAAHVGIVVTMLSDAPAVEEVLFGASGVADGARPGSVIIDSSTISPIATRDFGTRLASLGVAMLDAPVSGGQKGAVEGTLSFMVGGDEATVERVMPVLGAMGTRITHIGDLGAGQIAKACNQAIIAVSLLGISEALLLAARSGVDPARVREALLGGAAGSLLLDVHGRRMLDRDFEPGFRAALHHKDIGIARSLARSVRLPMPTLGLAEDLFASLLARGLGDADHSAIITTLEALAGTGSSPHDDADTGPSRPAVAGATH